MNEASVTESTTQILPRAGAMPIEEAAPLAPAYQAPLQAENSMGATTRRLEPTKMTSNTNQRSQWIRYWPVLFFIVCAVVAVIFLKPNSQKERVIIVRPPADFVAAPPAIPHIEAPEAPHPPPAPHAPSATGSLDDADALVYPNARVTMNIDRAGKGRVLQLSTADELDKVADWYANKLKPARIVRDGSNAVLEADGIKAVITASGNKTDVLLNQRVAQ